MMNIHCSEAFPLQQCFQNETLFNSQVITMDSIPSPQTNLFSGNAEGGILYTVQ